MGQQQQGPELGKLIGGTAFRDAVHVAVAPVTLDPKCRCAVQPGSPIGIGVGGFATLHDEWVGVVDPFLLEPVKPGQTFWLFLYPNTVTGLRHAWTHPAFAAKLPEERS